MSSVKLQNTKLVYKTNLCFYASTLNYQKEKLGNNPIHYSIRKSKIFRNKYN